VTSVRNGQGLPPFVAVAATESFGVSGIAAAQANNAFSPTPGDICTPTRSSLGFHASPSGSSYPCFDGLRHGAVPMPSYNLLPLRPPPKKEGQFPMFLRSLTRGRPGHLCLPGNLFFPIPYRR
jgi:hypothetical protein